MSNGPGRFGAFSQETIDSVSMRRNTGSFPYANPEYLYYEDLRTILILAAEPCPFLAGIYLTRAAFPICTTSMGQCWEADDPC